MGDKERLLDLILKREEVCATPLNQWLEELHYLFEQIKLESSITAKIRRIIEQIFSFVDDKYLLEEKVLQVKAKLFVFEKYEAEKLKNS